MDAVEEFHNKHGVGVVRIDAPFMASPKVENAAISLAAHARSLERDVETSPVVLAAHLLCEELSEFLAALNSGDIRETLDGLGDLLYVVIGRAVQFGIPLHQVFNAIVTSNNTKAVSGDQRVRGKGESYVPPQLDEIVDRYEAGL